jgi:hypothetical protein
MNKIQTAQLIIDYFHRSMMHNAMWFAEVQEKLGKQKAYEVMKIAADRSYDIHMKRLARILDFELEEGVPKPMLEMSEEKLEELKKGVAVNWLAMDGVWFQAVEFNHGMEDAKKCNDSTWGQFSPFEAWSIKKLLDIPENPGLEGLKTALQYRIYASINKQSFHDETENSFVFRMDDCRVQSARKRKGLDDYPCKSGGLVEYTTFAEAIDPRIKTECICCPPDKHPDEYYCSWRFSI